MLKCFLLILVWVLLPVGSNAATIVAIEESQLVKNSDVVAFGSIIRTQVKVSPRYGVYTEATLEIYEGIVGVERGDIITARVPGGQLSNGQRTLVSGAPILEPGERFVAFLEKRKNSFVPWGLSYGWLQVRDMGGGKLVVSRVLDGLYPVDKNGNKVAVKRVRMENVPLESLIERLRSHVPPTIVSPSDARGETR